jgi:uncharacterized protein (DUF58 family)
MLSSELIKKISSIHIKSNYLVNDILAGEYESAFRGRGMEFEEVREYIPGDDIRNIDWNVTARMGHPYVKMFHEERELTIMLMIDVSSSGQFGSVKELKNEVSAEIAAILAFTAIKSNDKVGLIIFSDRIEKFIPPKKGRSHVWKVIREIIQYRPLKRKTDISKSLEFFNRVMKRRCICFLLSDFLTDGYEKNLLITNKKHDVIAVTITDPRELNMPKLGIIELEDVETGEPIIIDTYAKNVTERFNYMAMERADKLKKKLRSMNVDSIDIVTDKPYIHPIMKFFKMREKRF